MHVFHFAFMREQQRYCHTDISLPSVQLRRQMHKCYAAHSRREEGTRLWSESPAGKVRSEVQVIMARCHYCFCQDVSLGPGSRRLRVPSVLVKTHSPVSLTQTHLIETQTRSHLLYLELSQLQTSNTHLGRRHGRD